MSFLKLDSYKLFVAAVVLAAIALTVFGLSLDRMYVLWPNFITLVVVGLLVSTIGFVIYGLIKGFENTFPND